MKGPWTSRWSSTYRCLWKTFLCCEPWPCSPIAKASILPLIWCFDKHISPHVFFSGGVFISQTPVSDPKAMAQDLAFLFASPTEEEALGRLCGEMGSPGSPGIPLGIPPILIRYVVLCLGFAFLSGRFLSASPRDGANQSRLDAPPSEGNLQWLHHWTLTY